MAEPIAPRPESEGPASVGTEVELTPSTDTLVLNVLPGPPEPPAPVRRRRRWIGAVIAVVAVGILVGAFFIADALARQYAEAYVRDKVVDVLQLPADARVDVQLGPGSLLLQAAKGSVDEVTVDVPALTFGDVTGSATLTATAVPLDDTKPVGGLDIVVTVDESNVEKLALSGLDLTDVALGDGLIRISTQFEAFFVTVPVSVDLEPSAVDGAVSFEPVTVLLGEDEISVADLRANPLFQSLAGGLLASQQFCVAQYLPQALTLDDVAVVGTDLVVTIDGDGTALSDPMLAELGTCP